MISLTHTTPNDSQVFGSLKAELFNPHGLPELETPVTFRVISSVSGKKHWEFILFPGTWSRYNMIFNTTAQFERNGKIISEFVWDTFLHGDLIHQQMMLWAMDNQGSFGVAIGTHNGETGEWVEPTRNGLLRAVLIEASDKQFLELEKNYGKIWNCKLEKCLVTPNGGETIFWESEDFDDSRVNSVKKDHVEQFTESLKGNLKKSIALNDLLDQQSEVPKWLHLDVEGIDIELIMSLSEKNISSLELIIYETLNSPGEEKQRCKDFLERMGFFVLESGWNTLATRKKLFFE
jgi:hypothetical protein